MKEVNCKSCGCIIYAKYNPINSLNNSKSIWNIFQRKKIVKYFSYLKSSPTDNCNTEIYLTCEKGHTNKYFCKIETIKNS